MTYMVTKNYGPENGLSATFRQWRADSHCRFIHGYALGVEVTFLCEDADLDENGWVYNFGGLKEFKAWLQETFDHKMLVAKDDPAIELFRDMANTRERRRFSPGREPWVESGQLIQLVEVERTGCEGFARMIADWLINNIDMKGRQVRIDCVRVYEHDGNSATYLVPHD
jgi:6-pyruvoyltetrahydropterin/6-carboxytetrahydropterin synthase